MSSLPTIEVFQELFLDASADLGALTSSLVINAKGVWRRDNPMEMRAAGTSAEGRLLAFSREGDDSIPAATVILYQDGNSSYKVTNVVPSELYTLTQQQYNMVLKDFIKSIVTPASELCSVRLSSDRQSPLDWANADAAHALGLFSRAANKSTGSSHPLDRERWMSFVVKYHRSGSGRLDAGLLARWLIEAEHWPSDSAYQLGSEFESAVELLAYYDGFLR
ncbi:hypothetical protein RB25_25230 [Herbaspirillum rubrisubalbicans]|uniref:Uncharacterized protein n=1 Tax=Herbaspirillum rubrisubalbicans Os34 TaxID=1235827 RepID=A0A6M3ZV60_9BURK|nr:hypothetical protein [Herbaspirillum rubrisubalbicans]QJQ02426.1 hypothetical protein C798_19955 [Herbaspirillum rubrisubalbicans Os34]RAN42701.1 hypothetical protein RB25_25230 [Herbaspirillum rubrisubalbicans]